MEQIELLEKYVGDLLQQIAALRSENQALKAEQSRLTDELIESQITAEDYQNQLKAEQTTRSDTVVRLDGLMKRIQSVLNGEGSAETSSNTSQETVASESPAGEAVVDEIL